MLTYLFVSSFDPEAAEHAVSMTPASPDLCVISPSTAARETALFAMSGRWIFKVEEPLLAARVPCESGADVIARWAQALRDLRAYDTRSALVVCDELGTLGRRPLGMDGDALVRAAEALESALAGP
jgi:hypothetical protein